MLWREEVNRELSVHVNLENDCHSSAPILLQAIYQANSLRQSSNNPGKKGSSFLFYRYRQPPLKLNLLWGRAIIHIGLAGSQHPPGRHANKEVVAPCDMKRLGPSWGGPMWFYLFLWEGSCLIWTVPQHNLLRYELSPFYSWGNWVSSKQVCQNDCFDFDSWCCITHGAKWIKGGRSRVLESQMSFVLCALPESPPCTAAGLPLYLYIAFHWEGSQDFS